MIRVVIFSFVLGHLSKAAGLPDVKIGVIIAYDGPLPWTLPRIRPAIEIARESIAASPERFPFHLSVTYRDSRCSDVYGPLAAIDFYVEKSAHVFIGKYIHAILT